MSGELALYDRGFQLLLQRFSVTMRVMCSPKPYFTGAGDSIYRGPHDLHQNRCATGASEWLSDISPTRMAERTGKISAASLRTIPRSHEPPRQDVCMAKSEEKIPGSLRVWLFGRHAGVFRGTDEVDQVFDCRSMLVHTNNSHASHKIGTEQHNDRGNS